jgi:hypothetical protein
MIHIIVFQLFMNLKSVRKQEISRRDGGFRASKPSIHRGVFVDIFLNRGYGTGKGTIGKQCLRTGDAIRKNS